MKPEKKRCFLPLAAVIVTLVLWLAGCAPTVRLTPRQKAIQAIDDTRSFPEFSDDMDFGGLQRAITQSLSYLQKIPADREFVFGADRFRTDYMIASLQKFLDFIQTRPSLGDLNAFIRTHYRIYRSVGRTADAEVLFTGYYEPHLQGSPVCHDDYQFPVFARPRDLVTIDLALFSERYNGKKLIGRCMGQQVVPYDERADITSENALLERAEVLAWIKDPVDDFFMQIQGSGKIYLDNGQVINVHYDVTNGQPYRSIGQLLIDENKISREQMSMQAIRRYLREHPEERQRILNHNPSYVFFKIEPNGPLGNINVPLTAGRSLALDRRLFPPGALAFIETEKPLVDGSGRIAGWAFLRKLDTTEADLGIGIAIPYTGRGLGRRLMDGLIAHARGRGVEAIELCHVAANERAHRLYLGRGFEASGTATHADGLRYVEMRLTLRA